jgi:hypothetical protein
MENIGKTKHKDEAITLAFSPSERTKETARIVSRVVGTSLALNLTPDMDLRETITFDSVVAYRIRRSLENALQGRAGAAILVTHSGIIHSIKKVFGIIPQDARFTPVEQGSYLKLVIPLTSCFEPRSSGIKDWRCETPEKYLDRISSVQSEEKAVKEKWRQATHTVHSSRDWDIIQDTWKEEKHLSKTAEEIQAYLAIAKFDCASLRDLNRGHLEKLQEIERLYPESAYLKYVQYPPFVWKLHIHIIKTEAMRHPLDDLLHYRNTVLFSDVLKTLEQKSGYMTRNLLVHIPVYYSFQE